MTTYAIIDFSNLVFRCHHITHGDAFTKAGMSLHIIFRSLKKMYRDFKVDHMVFCLEGRSWRYDVYPMYKASRRLEKAKMTEREKEDEEVFLSMIQDTTAYLAEYTRCTVLQSSGIEADDFVARWIQLHPNDNHIILSGDSDFIQLLDNNVKIYDGVNERLISTNEVIDAKGNSMVFNVDTSKGKLKVVSTIDAAIKAAKKEGKTFSFEPEPEWWRKALFVKIIRGDVGDGIFSAYPGVRYEGSSKSIGIKQAWEDRNDGGYHWNNFMLQKWEKLEGVDSEGNNIVKQVRVIDEYKFNESLIDLTKQPENIKDLMDTVIVQAVQKEPVSNVGVHFLRFCGKHNLPALSKEAAEHAKYLNSGYVK